MKDLTFEFPILVYSIIENVNPIISKGRVRIFYRGLNRNNTFISDEFAEKLIKTLPGSPVKGIYVLGEEDFTDHGTKRSSGRAYGFVSENPNFAWETHLDEDGVEREYACADIYIWTALYEEAKDIAGKPQSMELYPPSVQGEYKIMNGQEVFVFTDGAFLGLQVLGEKVEPCFEGAAFFTLFQDLLEKFNELYSKMPQVPEGKTGGKKMELNFEVSDSLKYDLIWKAMNPEYNEENDWKMSVSILDIFDTYFLAYRYTDSVYLRGYYTKDNESDTVTIDSVEERKYIDLSMEEFEIIERLRKEDSYEKLEENFNNLTSSLEAANVSLEEKDGEIAEKDGIIAANDETISTLKEENEALKEYKLKIQKEEKERILAKYAKILPMDEITAFEEQLETFSFIDLEKELSYKYTKLKEEEIFVEDRSFAGSYKGEGQLSGEAAIVSKHKRQRENGVID